MSPSRWRVGVMALALCAAGPATVEAQNSDIPRLSGRIMRSTSVFDDDQRNQVITYVEYWVDQLLNDSDPGGVAEGRDKLSAPFGSVGATDIFLAQYAAVVITRLGAADAADRCSNRSSTHLTGWPAIFEARHISTT